jgi:hypothetical protein
LRGDLYFAAFTEIPNFRDASWQKRRSDQSFFDAIAKGKGAIIAACPLKPTALATDKDGRIFAAWFSGGEKPAGSFFAVSEAGGQTFSKPLALHPEAASPDRPRIAVEADGGVIVVWDAVVGKERRVYLRRSTDRGKSFGPVTELNAPAGTASYPGIAAGANDKTFVTWQQNNRILLKAISGTEP